MAGPQPDGGKFQKPQKAIIDTGDLIFEIGKQKVELLKKQKLLDQAYQALGIQKRIADVAQEDVQRAKEIEESNKKLSAQNIALDQELTEARKRATDAEIAKAVAEKSLAIALKDNPKANRVIHHREKHARRI